MAIKPAGLQLSDALVRKARLARCRGIASWGLEHGGVIENPTSSFPRCRSALIARNCVRPSWNFLSLSLSLPFSFLFVRFLSRIWIVFFSFLYLASEGGKEKRFLSYLTLSRGVFESFWSSWSKGKTSVSKDACTFSSLPCACHGRGWNNGFYLFIFNSQILFTTRNRWKRDARVKECSPIRSYLSRETWTSIGGRRGNIGSWKG